MKILIAPGPYKECMDSKDVANNLANGLSSVLPHLEIEKFPMCDGGTGFTKRLIEYTNGKIVNCKVLGPLGYEINASFLSTKTKVRDKLKNLSLKKLDLKNSTIFKKNKTYIVRLNEKLNLNNSILGKCNPKSSTGRLNIFCRTILDYSDEYEKIPAGYP